MDIKLNLHVFSYYEFNVPTYRIWVDDYLYIEREFPTELDMFKFYVDEHISVDLSLGNHTIVLEKVRPKGNCYVWAEKLLINQENHFEELGLDINFDAKQIIKFKL